MSDLRWDDVAYWFDPAENGTVPDLVVEPTTLDDWQALTVLIRAAGWRAEFEHRDHRGDVPDSAAELFVTDPQRWLKYLHVWPDPDIEVMFRPSCPDEMVGDVSLFDLQGQDRLDRFCAFLRRLGQALGKRVALFAEGAGAHPPVLAYEVDQDRVIFRQG
ncbi:hypothetical protein [Actinoplanes sp. NBRC 101535]|uniref:hypothetical protein n=1 Tax=Actinoplanes sp. NBRC 101535 TaxID=3032196 RepID=UPI0024A50621|nr:hypothetical protein [Actinoplanes sp. NBRC 101535]GLY03029.1 hypothetical protein Acsp01_34080 [Actinoplanes sp. NBRC 101535]